jgi:hypothetical protein
MAEETGGTLEDDDGCEICSGRGVVCQGVEFDARVARRIALDPWWSFTQQRWGNCALEPAGFFDDGQDEAVDVVDIHWLGTPVGKISRREGGVGGRAVLLTTGAFSPLHDGHLVMMERAREALERRGAEVVGGYISPSHDDYVSSKYNGAAARPAQLRIGEAQARLAKSDWLMVDPWEAGVGYSINYTDVIAHLEAYLGRWFDEALSVYYVFGSDNAGFLRAFGQSGRAVCVPRDGEASALLELSGAGGVVAEPGVVLSSSALRVLGKGVGEPPDVECVVNGVSGEVCAVRNDLEVAARELGGDGGAFLERLVMALHQYQREGVGVRVVELSEQRKVFAVLADSTISLDPMLGGTYDVGLSRQFDLGDDQTSAGLVVGRPEDSSVGDVASRIEPGCYLLVDDDCSSGVTMAAARSVLGSQVNVVGEWYALEMCDGGEYVDVVDARDFLLGAAYSGLVVGLPDGSLGRAPYAWPYVSLWSRAQVDVGQCVEFTKVMWEANREYFTPLGTRVGELAEPTVGFLKACSFDVDTLVIDVIDTQLELCDRALALGWGGVPNSG